MKERASPNELALYNTQIMHSIPKFPCEFYRQSVQKIWAKSSEMTSWTSRDEKPKITFSRVILHLLNTEVKEKSGIVLYSKNSIKIEVFLVYYASHFLP